MISGVYGHGRYVFISHFSTHLKCNWYVDLRYLSFLSNELCFFRGQLLSLILVALRIGSTAVTANVLQEYGTVMAPLTVQTTRTKKIAMNSQVILFTALVLSIIFSVLTPKFVYLISGSVMVDKTALQVKMRPTVPPVNVLVSPAEINHVFLNHGAVMA